jgi:hypothetical protein
LPLNPVLYCTFVLSYWLVRVRYVYVRELFVNGSTGLGAVTCICGGT